MLGQFENLDRTTHAQVTVWGTVAEVDRVRNRLLPKVVRSSSLEHESQSAFQGCTVHMFGRGVHVGFIGRRASKPSPVGLQDFLGFLVGELGALVSMEPFWGAPVCVLMSAAQEARALGKSLLLRRKYTQGYREATSMITEK